MQGHPYPMKYPCEEPQFFVFRYMDTLGICDHRWIFKDNVIDVLHFLPGWSLKYDIFLIKIFRVKTKTGHTHVEKGDQE